MSQAEKHITTLAIPSLGINSHLAIGLAKLGLSKVAIFIIILFIGI
jgi:hypothetical protein